MSVVKSSNGMSTMCQIFTSSGTFSPNQGMKNLRAILVGGGGGGFGGQGAPASSVTGIGGPGGSSAPVKGNIPIPYNLGNITVTVGAGGAGGAGGSSGGGGGSPGAKGGLTSLSASGFYQACPGGFGTSQTFARAGSTTGGASNVNGLNAPQSFVSGDINGQFFYEGTFSGCGGAGLGNSQGVSGNGSYSPFTLNGVAAAGSQAGGGGTGGDGYIGFGPLVSASNGSAASAGSGTTGVGGVGYGAGGGGGASNAVANNGATGGAGGQGAPGLVVFIWEQ